MGRATGFQDDLGRRLGGEERAEAGAGEPPPVADASRRRRHGDLEDRLGEIDAELHTRHGDSSSGV
jgi:hypothetical protein